MSLNKKILMFEKLQENTQTNFIKINTVKPNYVTTCVVRSSVKNVVKEKMWSTRKKNKTGQMLLI